MHKRNGKVLPGGENDNKLWMVVKQLCGPSRKHMTIEERHSKVAVWFDMLHVLLSMLSFLYIYTNCKESMYYMQCGMELEHSEHCVTLKHIALQSDLTKPRIREKHQVYKSNCSLAFINEP